MAAPAKKASMRHLYLYAHFLLEEAKRHGKRVRLEWANIKTASIGPDPRNPNGLVLRLSHMAATGSEEDAILLRALIAHEILCHGNHTDFSVRPGPGVEGRLLNVLEDPRGELKAQRRFPGSKKVIREGIEVLTNRGIFAGPKEDGNHPASILNGWLVTELRSELLGQKCLEGFSMDWRKLAIQTFGAKLVGKVKAEALTASNADTTQDAAEAAKRIIQLLKMAPKEREEEEKSGDGQSKPSGQGGQKQQGGGGGSQDQQPPDDQDQQDGDDQKGGQGNQGDQGGQQNQSGGSDDSQNGGDGQVQATSQGDADGDEGHSDAGFEPTLDDLTQAIEAVLNSDEDEAGPYGKGLEQVLTENNEAMQEGQRYGGSHTNEMPEHRAPQGNGDFANRTELRTGAKATAAHLALKMEELLEAMSMVTRAKSFDGKLRTSRVHRALLGDLQIFQKRTRQPELDTCVYVLGDESGSMDEVFGGKLETQQDGSVKLVGALKKKVALGRVTVAIGDVLDRAEIPFGLATYDTSVREWKGFDDDWSETLTRYTAQSNGCTNTHLGVVWALRKFIERPEARKILLVPTDGDPGDLEVLEAAIHEAEAYGVEVRFVLIGSALAHHYKSLSVPYGVADSDKDLAKSVFGALESIVS